MAERLRAVLDTNIFLSALLSRNPTSPAKEIVKRWLDDEFTLLVCRPLIVEVLEKLTEQGLDETRLTEFAALLDIATEPIDVAAKSIPRTVQFDPDDDVIVACAVLGKADYLVTYDCHFAVLGEEYQGVKIVKALPFLWALRSKLVS
ncbi:MAG: putative toxin-antitoxin system toxin component, PIN family [Chloroflexota bacterium]|nr:putative toxin-antitoxin system toxin component, PIN family [Chloroflexota bacterium]